MFKDGDSMKEELRKQIIEEISNKILEVANCYNDVCTSDLQGIAEVKAREIFSINRFKSR